MLVGILPSSQRYEMTSVSIKMPSIDAVDNILTQTRAHLGATAATVALRRRS